MRDRTINAWLELITERDDSSIIVLDKERKICYANQAAAVMGGMKNPHDLLGVSYRAILAQSKIYNENGSLADPEVFPSNLAFSLGKETRDYIVEQVNPTSGHRWLSISSFPLSDQEKQIEYVAVFFDDISERKHREDQLKFLLESEKILSIETDLNIRLIEKARLLVPTLADWATVNIVNKEGSLERIAVVHRDPQKKPWVEEIATLAAEDVHSPTSIYNVLKTGKSVFFPSLPEPSASNSARSSRYAELLTLLQPSSAMIVPIALNNRVLGVLSLAYSESGRQYSNQDLEFMEEFGHHLSVVVDNAHLYAQIEERDKAKDLFLAALSHELRNPLAPIKNSLELLRLKNKNDDLEEEIATIEHQFEHLTELLKDLLDMNRFTHGKILLERSPCELRQLMVNVEKVNRPFIVKKGIDFRVSMSQGALWAEVDHVRLEQMLTNLLHNAEKFTPAGGSITLSLRIEDTTAIFTVDDTGIGIKKEDLAKIFDLYFQSEPEGFTPTGLGLGLILVRDIALLHGGSVKAYSAGIGKGSSFTIHIPIILTENPLASNSGTIESSTISHAAAQKILVVDDSMAVADSLVKLLHAVGFSARAAYSGSEGIEVFKEFNPDIMIVDIGMPEMDGHRVAQKLRKELHTHTPLIALTGYGLEEDRKKALDAGFDFHLTKPVGLKELQKVFKSILSTQENS